MEKNTSIPFTGHLLFIMGNRLVALKKIIVGQFIISIFFSSCVSTFTQNFNIFDNANDLNEKGEYLLAAQAFDKIIKLEESKSDKDEQRLFGAYLGAGNSYRMANVPDKAIQRYKIVIARYRALLQEGNITIINQLIGDLYYQTNEFDNALQYYKSALEMQVDTETNIVLLFSITNAYRETGDNKKAILSVNEYIQVAEASNNIQFLTTAVGMASIDFMLLGDSTLALETSDKLIALYKSFGDSAGMADGYENRGLILRGLNKMEAAIDNYQTAYDIYTKFGNDEKSIEMLENIGSLYLYIGMEYFIMEQYNDAIGWGLKSIKIHSQLGDINSMGESFLYIISSYIRMGEPTGGLNYAPSAYNISNRITDNVVKYDLLSILTTMYNTLGDYTKAQVCLTSAIPVAEVLNDKGSTASLYSSLGYNLTMLGKGYDAQNYLDKAYQLYEELKDSSGMAVVLKFIGMNYSDMGFLDLAENNYRKSYEISLSLGDSVNCASVLTDMSLVLADRGQYDHAEKACLRALEFDKQNPATLYNNLGLVYADWGQYDKALLNYQKSLKIKREKGVHDIVAELNNIAHYYEMNGAYDKALDFYKKALANAEEIGAESYYKAIIINISRSYANLGNIEQFFAYIEKYQNLNSQAVQIGEFIQVGIEIAKMYRNLGFTDQAIKFYKDVIDLGNKSGGFPKQVALALHGLGITYMYIEDYNQAIPNFLQAVEIYEKLRQTATGKTRRDYLATVISTYEKLSSSYLNVRDFKGVYNSIELSRAKLLTEQLAESDSLVSIPDLIEVQSSLSSNQAIVIYANVGWENLIEMVITNDTIISIEVPDSVLLATLYPDNEEATIELAIKSYRNSIKFFAETEKLTEFGRVFFDNLINPLDEHIQDKTDLLIIPDGILGYLPFEVLIDKNDQYLVENYNITYAQSVSVWDLIRNRKYDQQQATLLAVGGAVYNTQTYKVDMVKNDKMLAYLEKTTFDSISTRGSLRKSYASLGYSDWPNLPGSLEEINSISGVIEYTDKVVGDNATEETIKELSTGGELSKYNMLHFATHGIVVSDMPELSAVVLSQFEDELNDEDGYLTMGEIAELDIKADFVNLSACETGLGKIYSGEGVVGLTQAFMLAGANSVSVSLWPIADKATSEFMVSVYSKIAEGEDYSESINDTKRKFISGLYGKKYKHPYYWAPFVYYGK